MAKLRRFVKFERGLVPKFLFDRYVPSHLEYVKDLQKKGRLIETGYWAERGGGMMVFEAKDMKEARSIVKNDPLVKNKVVVYEIKEWKVVLPRKVRRRKR